MDRFLLNYCTSFGLGYVSKFPGTLASFIILIPLNAYAAETKKVSCNQLIFDYILAFIGFRVLDIFKPFPVSYFDKIKNSYGVLLDDLMAGSIIAMFFFIYYEKF